MTVTMMMVAMVVVVMMMGLGWNHANMLYYNITYAKT